MIKASNYRIGANADEYNAAMGSAERSTTGLSRSQSDLANRSKQSTAALGKLGDKVAQGRQHLNTFGKVALTAGASITTGLVVTGLKSADTLGKTADKLGLATERLAGLRHASELTGAGTAAMDKGIEKLNIRVAEAAAGTGIARKSFAALGLEAEDLVDKSPDEIFAIVADRLNGVESATQKTKIAYDIFGRSGTALINTMALGSDGLREMQTEAEDAGVALSRIDVAKAEIANDEVFRVRQQFQGFSQQLAIQFSPIIAGVADHFFQVGKEAGGMGTIATKSMKSVVKGVGVLADGVHGLNIGWNAMKLVMQSSYKFIIGSLDRLAEAAFTFWHSMPWTDAAEYESMFSGFLLTMESEIEKSQANIDRLLTKPLPSTAIEVFVEDTTRKFDEQAESVLNSQSDMQGALITTADVTERLSATTGKEGDQIKKVWGGVRTHFSGFLDMVSTDSGNVFEGMAKSWQATGIKMGNELLIDGAFGWLANFSAAAGYDNLSAGFSSQVNGGGISGLISSIQNLFTRNPGISSDTGAGGLFFAAPFDGGASLGGQGNATGVDGLYYAKPFDGGASLSGPQAETSQEVGTTAGAGSGAAGASSAASVGYAAAAIGIYRQINDIKDGEYGLGDVLSGAYAGIKYREYLDDQGPSVFGIGPGKLFGKTIEGAHGNLGGFQNEAFRNVFGGAKGGNNASRGTFDLSTGTISAEGIGNNFSEKILGFVEETLESVKLFSDTIGGSTFATDFKVGKKTGIKSQGKRYDTVDEFFDHLFDSVLQQSTDLDSVTKERLLAFEGAAPERQAFAENLFATKALADSSAFEQAIEAFNAPVPTLLENWNALSTELEEQIAIWDGTAESTANLVETASQSGAALFDLTFEIKRMGEAAVEAASDQARSIRESVLTTDELRDVRQAEFEGLSQSFASLVDPDEIAKNTERRLELNSLIFQSFSDELRKANAETYAVQAETIGAQADDALSRIADTLQQREAAQSADLHAMLQRNIQEQQQLVEEQKITSANNLAASENQLEAAQINLEASRLSNQRRNINAVPVNERVS